MITLASDFGSPYPAAMRGVVHRRTTGGVQVSDVAHDLPRQDPRAAAFWLRFVLPEYPPATHCVVVDPGVGTDRAALVVRAGDHVLVGPDNGVLLPPARALAASAAGGGERAADDAVPTANLDVYEIAVDDPASATFHGRDVFAPTAADVHEVGVDALGTLDALSPTDSSVDLRFPSPTVESDGDGLGTRATGEVLVVDDFGNAITNVPGSFLDDRLGESVTVTAPDRVTTAPAVETFAAVAPGDPLVTVGSHGYVECDVNEGRGEEAFGLASGDPVTLAFGLN
ncbi:S-adenosyl-l-methionine hydroxide adenosyltransferase family protein [Halobaculum sp. MBLA0147]|uniref:SAM hydrolase/SAM-dependent halogenase family protein n=1 Tax=Halobaculum sp. MBLA0147 TaxID=3079934 RepID=UPI0035245140